jgi:hypothetical protein
MYLDEGGVVQHYPLMTEFGGQTVALESVLARYTFYGDVNLDGVVDGLDYIYVDAAFTYYLATGEYMSGWLNGDFNYDGVVDQVDYIYIDGAFTYFLGGGGAGGLEAVPEPATLSLLALGLAAAFARRRAVRPVSRRR